MYIFCNPIAIAFNCTLSVLISIFIILVIYSYRKYLHNLSSATKKKAIWLHRMIILFYIFTIIYLFTSIPILIITPCSDTPYANMHLSLLILIEVTHLGYCGHWLFMVSILFSRLFYIFRDTIHSLSKVSINIFKLAMGIIIISIPIALYFKSTSQTLAYWILFVVSIWFLSLYTVFLFIYKLRQFHALSTRYTEDHMLRPICCIFRIFYELIFTVKC